ncbi:D-glycero-beta-D-manno-heptose 1,7-bisphosphate 7-phosphatase [Mycolicibacterium mucogenicum]|uniref:D-glycero-beta-D-manno-heptose 1,7-bisphosphate 7-phosphatase n=1 Tax=Mycolicibacterium mucogenicum TaxID=56689 RepID=UPI00226A9DE9|nr:D-glycero-beta-D-manno-heptose 1,7-bisphosphate 7-phosphatase [Mycolicibacterium mucogenicum]
MAEGIQPSERRRAVFLDRDGVLNVDRGFVAKPDDFEWVRGAREAVRFLNGAGYLVVVVTNQSGIGRGFHAESDFRSLHNWIDGQLENCGAYIDAVYFCPHLPDAPLAEYRVTCECRKPRPGMLQQAIREWDIDPAQSFLIGDRDRDCAAAAAAGVAGYLFDGPDLFEFVRTRIPLSSNHFVEG